MGFVGRIRFIGFGEENSPSDPPKSLFCGKDLPPIVTGIGSAGFSSQPRQFGWVGQFLGFGGHPNYFHRKYKKL